MSSKDENISLTDEEMDEMMVCIHQFLGKTIVKPEEKKIIHDVINFMASHNYINERDDNIIEYVTFIGFLGKAVSLKPYDLNLTVDDVLKRLEKLNFMTDSERSTDWFKFIVKQMLDANRVRSMEYLEYVNPEGTA